MKERITAKAYVILYLRIDRAPVSVDRVLIASEFPTEQRGFAREAQALYLTTHATSFGAALSATIKRMATEPHRWVLPYLDARTAARVRDLL